jgi:protein disulfide-isomerase
MVFRRLFLFLLCVALLAPLSNRLRAGEPWLTDLATAQAKAQAENKAVLIHFSGSDWCGWCMKLRKEVFAKADFDSYARTNLVLLTIDFPKHKPVAPGIQSTNQHVAEQFQVQGFPTLVLLDAQGKRLGNVNYAQGGVKPFLAEVERVRQAALAREAAAALAAAPNKPAESTNAVAHPPGLTLNRITGSKQRRRAVINDYAFAAGESATLKLADGAVRVQCLEIRGSSVLISVNGQKEKRELRLSRRT